jgi:hypothetical protein
VVAHGPVVRVQSYTDLDISRWGGFDALRYHEALPGLVHDREFDPLKSKETV